MALQSGSGDSIRNNVEVHPFTRSPVHPFTLCGCGGVAHIGLRLGLEACQKGLAVGFITASALVHELLEARDKKRLLRLQKQLTKYRLLIIDELGYVPLSPTGAELLFEVFSRRHSPAMLSSPRRPSRTILIFSSEEYCVRVARLMSLTIFSDDLRPGPVVCLMCHSLVITMSQELSLIKSP
jgi:IstB-like ATP binding protein